MKRKNFIKKVIYPLLIISFVQSICFSSVISVIMEKEDGTKDSLPGITYSDREYISLSHLCNSMGKKWKWDLKSETFSIIDIGDTIHILQDNYFYRFNDSTLQFPYKPVRYKENLYADVQYAITFFPDSTRSSLYWNKKNRTISFIPSVSKTKKTTVSPKSKSIVETGEVSAKNTLANDNLNRVVEKIKIVVIDPGHGGKDPGAIGSTGTFEKDVVLKIGLAMRDALREKSKELKVYMTRSKDIFIPLRQRTKFANNKKADLFISIHANSIAGNKKRKNNVKGYKIYFLSQAKNEDDKLAAMIENSVIELEENIQKGDLLQNILIDMANNEYLSESQDMSILIVESMKASFSKVRALHTGVGQANFWVLNGAYMPSVLVETCFISNPAEEKMLTNKNFQKKMGVSICNAVLQFKKKYEAGL